MSNLFLITALVGGGLLVLQLLLNLLGLADHELFDDAHHLGGDAGEALNLFSMRALSAGLAFFGLGGLLIQAMGLPLLLALPVGVAAGLAAAVAVAYAMRLMMRLEEDGSIRLERAIGSPATVYLSIPGDRSTPGKVHLSLQGRTVECQAVSEHPLKTGAPVVVMDVIGPDTVMVAPQHDPGGLLDVPR